MMRIRVLPAVFGLVLLGLAALGLSATLPRAQEDQGILAGFISNVLSTPTSRVNIGDVEGALSSDATIRNVTVADAQGVWLSIDRIRLVWRRTALLARRLEIQQLEIGRVELSRMPASDPSAPPAPSGPLLPELPLKVEIGRLALAELALGAPVLGVEARLSATGQASLGAPSEGLDARFQVTRLDAPGTTALSLQFVPTTERLELSVQHDEPAGGLVARLANLPGLPPVKLDVTGSGPLDDWRARIGFDAGPDIAARGSAVLAGATGGRQLTLDLDARLEALLPPAVAPIFAGDTSLDGLVRFGEDGSYAIERLRLASDLAELGIAGRLSADQQLDVTATARALSNEGSATRRGATRLEDLVLDARVQGPLASPMVSGQLDLRGLETPALRLGSFSATVAAEPQNGGAVRYRLALDGNAAGVVPTDPGLAQALGQTLTLALRAAVDEQNVADVSQLSLATPTLRLGYQGRAGASLLEGRALAEVLDVASLSTLAGRPLAGQARLAANLSGDPSQNLRVALDGSATALSLGDAVLDRLTGGGLTLSGTLVRIGTDMTAEGLVLGGRHVSATVNGGVRGGRLDVTGQLALPDLRQADARLAGAARLDVRGTGEPLDPDMSLVLAAPEARALDRPIRDLRLSLEGRTVASAPTLAVTASGEVDRKPLTADIAARGDLAGVWMVERLLARLGSVSIDGQGQRGADGLATGRLALVAGDLDDLSALVLTRLAGRLNATITADAADGRQNLSIQGEGDGLVAGGATLNRLRASLTGQDVLGRPVFNGEATIDRLLTGGERIDSIAFRAAGTAEATDMRLTARARGFDLTAAGKLLPGAPNRFDLATFTAARTGARIALAAPATLLIQDGGVRTERLALRVLDGEVEVAGLLGGTLDLTAIVRRLPLAAVDIVAPGTGLRGTVDARATLKGPAAAPTGPYEINIRGLSAPATRDSGVPVLNITARGQAQGSRASVEARVAGGQAIALDITGHVPLSATGSIDLRARGTLDAGLANASLSGAGQRVAGRIAVDAAVRGTAARPDIQGNVTLSGGSFSDPLQGISLTAIEGRASGRGNSIAIERLTARTRNGGTITVTGRVEADAARGFPADLRIGASNAQLIKSDLAELVTGLDLTISGPLATTPRIGGRINVSTLELRVPDRLPSSAEPLRDARHIAPPPQTRARLAQIARQNAGRARRGPAFNAALDVVIDAPGRVFVRGRGIDAELGGTVRLAGTTTAPSASGGFEMRRGRLSILTQRLDFTRGRITFVGGDLVPELDFLAETRAAEITARIAVTGPANQPAFVLSSSPSLPQDEVLSRLLFARAAGGLSAFQAVQLAQAVVELSGAGGGPDAFENARRALGVDNLDVTMGASGPAVGVSRAINDRVRLGVRAGATPESSAVGVDIDLTRRLRIQSEVGADGRASAGVGIEMEY